MEGKGSRNLAWRCRERSCGNLYLFLHPVAVVLLWIDLRSRNDLVRGQVAWATSSAYQLVPFVLKAEGGDLFEVGSAGARGDGGACFGYAGFGLA